jgi:hypothetical protein
MRRKLMAMAAFFVVGGDAESRFGMSVAEVGSAHALQLVYRAGRGNLAEQPLGVGRAELAILLQAHQSPMQAQRRRLVRHDVDVRRIALIANIQ